MVSSATLFAGMSPTAIGDRHDATTPTDGQRHGLGRDVPAHARSLPSCRVWTREALAPRTRQPERERGPSLPVVPTARAKNGMEQLQHRAAWIAFSVSG